jgi:hypothetical protein
MPVKPIPGLALPAALLAALCCNALFGQAPAAPPAPTPAAVPGTDPKTAWTKPWMDKYVKAYPRTDNVYVLIDAETLHAKLEGSGNHAAVAREALELLRCLPLPAGSPDLVKLDVVYFKDRDSYGAPLWDSVERLGHLEFSRKALVQASPGAFAKGEADWKGLFLKAQFFQ